MKWISTNKDTKAQDLKSVLFTGLAPDGGLFMPAFYPKTLVSSESKSLAETAHQLLHPYFSPDIAESDLADILTSALNFDIPLKQLSDDLFVLELFHGPTLAFKDVGARTMAGMMDFLYDGHQPLTILAATSGDTGSAVASAFLGRDKFNVVLLYPAGKVSKVQEQQLTTFGQNITALEIDGNFDDCQKLVKQAFSDKQLRAEVNLTSANSINVGRWLPQAVYYLHAIQQLKKMTDAPPVISVPSGNLGNLAAGLMAQKHGAEIRQFIGACNANTTFSDFISTGKFRPRSSVRTLSNAMDVGNPSNFERIHYMYDGDFHQIKKIISAGSCYDERTLSTVSEVFEQHNYLMCPHTAVGYGVLMENKVWKSGEHPGIVLATAHPAKFGEVIQKVISDEIPLPNTLASAINKMKQSMKMENDYTAFSEYLRSKI